MANNRAGMVMSEATHYKEWAMMGDVIAMPDRTLLIDAYKRAVIEGDLGVVFASVHVARAYVKGLNRRFGNGAYDVGMCTVPATAKPVVKHRMMFVWCVAVGHGARMLGKGSSARKQLDGCLERIRKKYVSK